MNCRKKMTGRDMVGFSLLGLSLIMLGRSVMLCFSNDIWYDELFTVGLAEHSYGELIRLTAADVHPPLYYCIVKLFVDLCKLIVPGVGTIISVKIASVLPYFILMIYAVTFLRKRFGLFVGGMFLFCVTAMPQLPAYTVEMRMYGWALLFVTAAFLHGYALIESYVNCNSGSKKSGAGVAASTETAAGRHAHSLHGAAFVLYGLAAAYTQYFACVAVVMVYLFVLLAFWFRDRRRIREWLLYVIISVVCYVPWLFALAGQLEAVSENYWILPLTWRSLGGCVKFLMKPAFADERVNTVLALVLFVAYLGLWCRWALKLFRKGRENDKICVNTIKECCKNLVDEATARFWLATAGVGVLAGLVAFGFAASFLIRPIFVYRYMIPAVGCFWLGFALCLNNALCKSKAEQNDFCGGGDASKKLCKLNSAQLAKKADNIGRHNIGRNTFSRAAGIALTIFVVIVGLRDYRAFMGEEEYKIRLMTETEEALALIGPQDSVVYNFDQVQAVTGYYLPETTARFLWRAEGEKLIQKITSPCGTVEETEELREMLDTAGEEDRGKNLWFIGSFNSREDIAAEWREDGLEVEERGSFLLERYWFNLYKIS